MTFLAKYALGIFLLSALAVCWYLQRRDERG